VQNKASSGLFIAAVLGMEIARPFRGISQTGSIFFSFLSWVFKKQKMAWAND